MFKLSYDEITARITEKTGISREEIDSKVDQKVQQLSGLVSREGAAHILANEFGIRLFEQLSGRLQIKNVISGMGNVEILGKVVNIYGTKTFNSNGREGKVASMVVADETGQIRVVLWNEQADNADKLKTGDIIKIKGGYARSKNNGNEIHTNDKSRVTINPEGETINLPTSVQPARKKLSELQGNESSVEVLATIVQAFEPRYFEVCKCGKRAKPSDNGATCDFHGTVKPEYSYVMNAFIDDGTDSLRAVFFREQAQKLLGKTHEDMLSYKDQPELFETARNDLLGANVKITGRATRNEMFDRIEFIAQQLTLNPDPNEEIARLEQEMKELRTEKSL
ncbi:hypothetical protein HY640_01905 [Candidatus Woesearchaeota archaeon]|nr:hypothetical protein [Candidatus Woesearchaeota archaeon]